jgi:hypothetical protein
MSGRFAVLQKTLDPPPLEALRRACGRVPGLAAVDAGPIHRDAFGILIKDFSREQATAFHEALSELGVETEVIEQAALPELPMVKFVPRLDCEEAGLNIHDSLGRATLVEWPDVMLVAVGNVRVIEFTRRPVGLTYYSYEDQSMAEEVVDVVSKEEQRLQLCLDIITARAERRFSAIGDRMNFVCLGARKADRMPRNFTLLAQDIIAHAPHATLNTGAYQLHEGVEKFFEYPTKGAFAEEMSWLLYRMKQVGWNIGGPDSGLQSSPA